MTLTEIRQALSEMGVRPSRQLGQNFLHDKNVAARIVELCRIREGDSVVEIGPGLGALTRGLLEARPGRLLLLERDHRFAAFLRERFPSAELIEGDAMKTLASGMRTDSLLPGDATPPSRFRDEGVAAPDGVPLGIGRFSLAVGDFTFVGNLPYSVASPLIVRLAEPDLRPQRMVFTIQLEVAERLAARADTKDYGLLTLLVAPFYKVEIARRIPTSVFWPAPEVKSATVVLTRHAGFPFPTLDEEARFGRIVRRAFQQRRKTLGAVFGDELPDPALRPRRPAELDLEAWARATAISFADRTDPEADPSDEIFEIVDKDDRVVGRVPRRRVHAEHLLHRAVHVFVKNSQGEILLQRRSPLKDMAPNTWDSAAAGHLAVGESYDACARREIVEELGTSVPLTPVRKYDACEALGWEFIHLYEARAEGPFRFPPAEISELRWWEPSAVDTAIEKKSADFAASFRHLWIRFRSAQVAA